MSFAEHLAADRRLALLRLVKEAGGSANESVLETGLRMLGHAAGLTREVVRADMKLLGDAGCLDIEFFLDKVMVGRLTRRGHDVTMGSIEVAGVKRPLPFET